MVLRCPLQHSPTSNMHCEEDFVCTSCFSSSSWLCVCVCVSILSNLNSNNLCTNADCAVLLHCTTWEKKPFAKSLSLLPEQNLNLEILLLPPNTTPQPAHHRLETLEGMRNRWLPAGTAPGRCREHNIQHTALSCRHRKGTHAAGRRCCTRNGLQTRYRGTHKHQALHTSEHK